MARSSRPVSVGGTHRGYWDLEGGGLSDMFGGGMSSGNVGGSTVVEKNLDRLTVGLSVLFAISTLTLTWLLAT